MRLSDVMSHFGLTTYPIAGLILFLGVFIGVVFRVMGRKRACELERIGLLPLSSGDDAPSCMHRPETRE